MNLSTDERTVYCGNLSDQVTEELLYELFLQAAPLEKVRIPTDRQGRKSNYAFVTFKHAVSVNYATQLLNGTALFDKKLNIKPRNNNQHNMELLREQSAAHNRASIMNTFANLMRLGDMMRPNLSLLQLQQQPQQPLGNDDLRHQMEMRRQAQQQQQQPQQQERQYHDDRHQMDRYYEEDRHMEGGRRDAEERHHSDDRRNRHEQNSYREREERRNDYRPYRQNERPSNRRGRNFNEHRSKRSRHY